MFLYQVCIWYTNEVTLFIILVLPTRISFAENYMIYCHNGLYDNRVVRKERRLALPLTRTDETFVVL